MKANVATSMDASTHTDTAIRLKATTTGGVARSLNRRGGLVITVLNSVLKKKPKSAVLLDDEKNREKSKSSTRTIQSRRLKSIQTIFRFKKQQRKAAKAA